VDHIRITIYYCVSPTANFSANATSGCAPLSVQFTDTSTGSPTGWSWTFGDGGNSTAQNPSHNYTSAGTYNVTLMAINTCGNNTQTKTNYITVYALPVCTITAPAAVCALST
jgi:PKD repeat protein